MLVTILISMTNKREKELDGLARDAISDVVCMDECPTNIEEATFLSNQFNNYLLSEIN